ncbi:hypothetical protein [Bacillus ndiopicus]|uniref:hypothetical protein n=1 Tax=Bacillus ndiopicus TaxID=1347368 RepID=UPI0012B508FC|nr:hypothetical protein [Bacillus ndiopicus]
MQLPTCLTLAGGALLLHFVDAQYERYLQALEHILKQKYIERFITLDNRGHIWKDKMYEDWVCSRKYKG